MIRPIEAGALAKEGSQIGPNNVLRMRLGPRVGPEAYLKVQRVCGFGFSASKGGGGGGGVRGNGKS